MPSKPKKDKSKEKSKSPKGKDKSRSKSKTKKKKDDPKRAKSSSNERGKSPAKNKSSEKVKKKKESPYGRSTSKKNRDKTKEDVGHAPISPIQSNLNARGEGQRSNNTIQKSLPPEKSPSYSPLQTPKNEIVGSGDLSKKNALTIPSRRLSFQNPSPLPIEKLPSESPKSSQQTLSEPQPQWARPPSISSDGKRPSPQLVPYNPPENDPTQERRGSRRLSQESQPPKSPNRLSILTASPPPSPAGSMDRRKPYGSIASDSSHRSSPIPTKGISDYPPSPAQPGKKLSIEKDTGQHLTPPIPSIGAVIQESRQKSSIDRAMAAEVASQKRDSRPHDDLYELTVYKNKGKFDPAFKEHKAHLITPNTLYKEALYTSVHYLGVPTVRFPSTKEDLCLYSHIAFKAEPKEQVHAMEHVVGEPYPLTVVNSKIRRADGIEARDFQKLPDPYCIVAVESTESGVEFQLSIKEWQTISTGSPLRPKHVKSPQDHTRPPPEKRHDQIYSTVPPFIKTAVQIQTRAPTWEQRFQCLALRPSIDTLTIELWDNESDQPVLENTPHGRKWSSSDKSRHNKSHDVYIGKVSLPVRDISCEGESKWHYIKGTTHRKREASGRLLVEIWLTHAYRHGRNYEEYAEPRQTLEMLWDHILQYESSRFSGTWNGEIPPAATCLIFQYALQTGISEASQAIVRWNAYAKYNLGLFSLERRLSELEHALDKARDWKVIQECELETNMVMLAIEKILPVIRNHLYESQDVVHEAVKSIKHCRDILTKFECQSGIFKVQFWIEAEIRMAILEWYDKRFSEFFSVLDPFKDSVVYDRIECLARLINDVNALMRECASKWKPLFWLDGLIDYMSLAFDEFQKMIIHDVESLCFYSLKEYDTNEKLKNVLLDMSHSQGGRNLCKALFDLYVQTQVFVVDQEKIFDSNSADNESKGGESQVVLQKKYLYLNRYHRWFRPVLVLWLGYALIKASDMISRSIKIDTVVVQDEYVLTSSSATDAGVVFFQLVTFWQQLNWPDVVEGYVILHYIFEVMCFVTIMYARLKRAKLEKESYFDTVDTFDISERLCTALNNIEYVKESLIKIPDDIKMDDILIELDKAVGDSYAQTHRHRINTLLTGTLSHVDLQCKKIMMGVAERVRPELRSRFAECFHFLQDSAKTEDDSLVLVLEYLENNIVVLHKKLLELNFIRILQMFWNVTCQVILNGLKHFTKSKDARTHGQFFQRVKNIIPTLRVYFEGGGGGLNAEEIETKYYKALNIFLSCLSLPTEVLIAAYFREAAEEQMEKKEKSKLGSLTVRVNYHSGALAVEVISASNLSARDEPWKFFQCCSKRVPSSDPHVEISLEPPIYFKDVKKQKTDTKFDMLNPVFNEKFSWIVSEGTCSKPEAVIVFTVWDYDRLSRNDFLGQAVVPIAKMPGLMKMRPIGQPMTLELQSVETKHNPVLTILQNRTWDSVATNFAQEQAERVITVRQDSEQLTLKRTT